MQCLLLLRVANPNPPDVQAHDLSMKSAVAKQGLRGRAVKYHAVSAFLSDLK